jgi:uncharacterized membrane protein
MKTFIYLVVGVLPFVAFLFAAFGSTRSAKIFIYAAAAGFVLLWIPFMVRLVRGNYAFFKDWFRRRKK